MMACVCIQISHASVHVGLISFVDSIWTTSVFCSWFTFREKEFQVFKTFQVCSFQFFNNFIHVPYFSVLYMLQLIHSCEFSVEFQWWYDGYLCFILPACMHDQGHSVFYIVTTFSCSIYSVIVLSFILQTSLWLFTPCHNILTLFGCLGCKIQFIF